MNLSELEKEFANLGENYKTKDVDRLNRRLIKNHENVDFLGEIVMSRQEFHRTFFQVSLGNLKTVEEKFDFIEKNFDKLQDWWHVDQLSQFVDKYLTFDFAYEKAEKYVQNDLAFVRRWGYVMFMPNLVKDEKNAEKLFLLFKNDNEYYVQMAQAWLLSYLAIYFPQKTLDYLKKCSLDYNITGKAIQKTCDSFRVSNEVKEKFKDLRKIIK